MMSPDEFDVVRRAADHLRPLLPLTPRIGIVLGTGLGRMTEGMEIAAEIDVGTVPGMLPPAVASHQGKLQVGQLAGASVAVLAGRVHYYEGHSMQEVVRPVRILHALGCTHLITTNAAGGIHPSLDAGDVVMIRDHINLMGAHPLRGPNEDRWGPRFPDMSEAYDPEWARATWSIVSKRDLPLKTGVYAGLSGPSLETPAEYTFLYRIGADLVGMSAVPEVLAARHLGMRVMGLSVISNECYPPERVRQTTVEEVIRVVRDSASKAREILHAAIRAVEA